MEIIEGIEAELGGTQKRLAVFITVIGLFLAVAETMAKGAQTQSIASNVEASNLWSFYQAKAIRQSTLKTASDQMEVDIALAKDPAVKTLLQKRVADWKKEIDRYQSEPKAGPHHENLGVGRVEIEERAHVMEEKREVFTNQYHCYEIGAAAFQIAIVMAGVYLLTQVTWMLLVVAGLVGGGLIFTLLGLLSPATIHLLLPH